MKISTALSITLALLISFTLISGLLVRSSLVKMVFDGKVVNFVGIVRGGSQRLIKLELAKNYTEGDKLIVTLDKYINGLIEGDNSEGLPKAKDEDFIKQMHTVAQVWNVLKDTINEARTNPVIRPKMVLESEEFFKLTNEATLSAEGLSYNNVIYAQRHQLVLLVLNIIILGAVWITTKRKILKPIAILKGHINSIVNKDLCVSMDYNVKDEIGELANEIN
ncbi:MAG: hypothetical protein L3V56_09915, partial [Candidatus Magnetoovum sp. WYHC-5]|nr:hypothetical protein [Candidatus Magnetoovum sp. WYHC-5]